MSWLSRQQKKAEKRTNQLKFHNALYAIYGDDVNNLSEATAKLLRSTWKSNPDIIRQTAKQKLNYWVPEQYNLEASSVSNGLLDRMRAFRLEVSGYNMRTTGYNGDWRQSALTPYEVARPVTPLAARPARSQATSSSNNLVDILLP